MKKVFLLSSILASTLFGAELQWGHGTIDLKGGFVGLDKTISDDIDTYSLVEQHSSISDTNFFYSYTLTILDSKKIRQLRKDINSGISNVNSIFKSAGGYVTIPSLNYTIQGFDGGVTLGYDLLKSGDRDYLGVGVYGGVSVPYIHSSKNSLDTVSVNLNAYKYLQDSDTDISTYKVGVGLFAQKSLSDMVALYGNAVWAYQNGNIENTIYKIDLNIDGNYLEFAGGLKINAQKNSKLSGLYGTIGYRYREWKINDVSLNVTGIAGLESPKSDLEFTSNALTVGIGYTF